MNYFFIVIFNNDSDEEILRGHDLSFFERSHNGPEKYTLLSRRYMPEFLIYIFS